MDGFKYRHSVHEETHINGDKKETLTYCSCCGEKHKGNYGMTYSWNFRGTFGIGRTKLCAKCAKKIAPIYMNAEREIRRIIDEHSEVRMRNIETHDIDISVLDEWFLEGR